MAREHNLTVYSDLSLITDHTPKKPVRTLNLVLDRFRRLSPDMKLVDADPVNPENLSNLYTSEGTFQNQDGKWVLVVAPAKSDPLPMQNKRR